MPFVLKPRQTVLFIGDSITDCGRRAEAPPLGNGYVRMISELIDARYPERQINVVNTGIGGNNVADLAARWHDDMARYQPDWLSVKIGINDVHQWLGSNRQGGVNPERFEELYDQILARAGKETGAKLILIDPFYISTESETGSWRTTVLEELGAYIKVVAKMARKYHARRVKTHDLFQKALKYYPPARFCPEPVHPFAAGHLLIAQAWLKEMGY